MLVNDIIQTKIFIEVAGYQSVVTSYYKVIDGTILTTLEGVVDDLHGDWWTRIHTFMSADAISSCIQWINLMGNDPTVERFNSLPGLDAGDALAPKNVWKVTSHAINPPNVEKTGTQSISGLSEAVQAQGEFVAPMRSLLQAMLTENINMVAGPVLRGQLQYVVTGVTLYSDIINVTENRSVKEMRNRVPGLCAVA